MVKILVSLLAMIITVLMVSTLALSLFSDTAAITGITFATGNAKLLVGRDADSLGPTWAVLGPDFQFLI